MHSLGAVIAAAIGQYKRPWVIGADSLVDLFYGFRKNRPMVVRLGEHSYKIPGQDDFPDPSVAGLYCQDTKGRSRGRRLKDRTRTLGYFSGLIVARVVYGF